MWSFFALNAGSSRKLFRLKIVETGIGFCVQIAFNSEHRPSSDDDTRRFIVPHLLWICCCALSGCTMIFVMWYDVELTSPQNTRPCWNTRPLIAHDLHSQLEVMGPALSAQPAAVAVFVLAQVVLWQVWCLYNVTCDMTYEQSIIVGADRNDQVSSVKHRSFFKCSAMKGGFHRESWRCLKSKLLLWKNKRRPREGKLNWEWYITISWGFQTYFCRSFLYLVQLVKNSRPNK